MPTIEILTLRKYYKLLLVIVALYILFYVRNKRFNVFQITNSYFVYAYSIFKQIVEILDCMGLLVIYKTICYAFQLNTLVIKQEIKIKM